MSILLMIANLPHTVTSADLERWLLEAQVPVSGVQVARDRFSNEPRGFAWAEVETGEQADMLIAARSGSELAGRTIVVARARFVPPKLDAPQGPR